ncbi:iron ABC transporter substrate-binding protein [Thalassospira profundimaris]|uniref:Iron ABC transporter substrate-binding protein n=1 Tax=Thalassospira profundimaris TaxID=502049 RepID=A0A367XD70_9PROT|nr:ABC transporter ATP-binding protein [Thalassospira profundimaris]RCK50731.1 iron ABC transporter substrate-binding protein [Thalassospira profundimaris]
MFDLKDVGFRTEGKTAKSLLSGITVSFPTRAFSAIVGHNGSGKSTLLKILARKYRQFDGNIQMGGIALEDRSIRDFAREVAYLPQNPTVPPHLTVRELVGFGRYPWRGAFGRYRADDYEKIDQAMALTHVDDIATRLVASLSGGERQRVWLAMLLAQDAPVLLLDEPTSALDVGHQRDILHLVSDLKNTIGLTVIAVLHDIDMVGRFADHILALRHGKTCWQGTAHNFMQAETLGKIYDADIGVIPVPHSNISVSYIA